MKNNTRYFCDSIDSEFNLDTPGQVLLLGGEESARADIEVTLSAMSDTFSIVTFTDPEQFTNDAADADTALLLLIANGDGDLDSLWFTRVTELQSPAPVVLIDAGDAVFDERLSDIAWRHLNLRRGDELRSELDTALYIGCMRRALQRSRNQQSLTTAGITSILNQDAGANAMLDGTTLVKPTSALAGLLGASSVDQLAGADILDWIKESDTSIFHDVLKRARRDAEPADVVIRIVSVNEIDYSVRVFLAPPARQQDRKAPIGDMQLIMASVENRFRADLPACRGHTHIGGRTALHSDLAAPRVQAKGNGFGLIAAQIDELKNIEDKSGLAATDLFTRHFGLAFAAALEAGDRCYQVDTGLCVAFVKRDSGQSIGETAKTLQAALTNRSFDNADHEENNNAATVTVSVCHIELDEGMDAGWNHDERLRCVVRGAEALSRLGGNSHRHHEDIAAAGAGEAEFPGQTHLTVAQSSAEPGTHGTLDALPSEEATFDDGMKTPLMEETERTTSAEEDMAGGSAGESDLPPMADIPSQTRAAANNGPEIDEQRPWTGALREALANDGFSLAYQGVTDLSGTDKPYFDVLLRYVDADGNLIEAGEFLPDAARSGLMPKIDHWVASHAVEVVGDQRDSNKPIGLFVKLSPLLLPHAEDFVTWLIEAANSRQIERGDLIFSFRESDINEHGESIDTLISSLSEEGFRTALTHVSSTQEASSLLVRLPFAFVKLSAPFAHSIISDDDDRPLHEMIGEMRRYNVPLIAEQIENADAMAKLWQAGINYVQGNFIQEPDTQTFRRQKTRA